MEITCQRCHETLREADRYCSVCGLPQLMYVAAETPATPLEDGADGDTEIIGMAGGIAGGNSGSGSAGLVGGAVSWRPALRSAVILGIPAGVLCSGLTPIGQSLGLVWMLGAAAWAVSLYAKRARPGGLTGGLTMGAGARIGLVTGLFASWLTVGVNGTQLWLSRFVFHQGSEIDSLLQTTVEKSLQLSQQMIVGMGVASAQMAQSQQLNRSMMLSAEGRAGMVLSGFLSGAAFLVLFAVIGGAVGARFLAHPRRPSV